MLDEVKTERQVLAAKATGEITARPRAQDLSALYLDDVFRYVSAFISPETEAEDVAMEVFHAAFSSLNRLKKGMDARFWLLGIARNKVADSLRRKYRRREYGLKQNIQHTTSDVDQTIIVGTILRQIPPDHAHILVLKYVNGLSIEEIGTQLGRSTAASNSLLQRARESFYAKGSPHFLRLEDQL